MPSQAWTIISNQAEVVDFVQMDEGILEKDEKTALGKSGNAQ